MECLTCRTEFATLRGLGVHVARVHGIPFSDYKDKFGLTRRCEKCGGKLSKNCKKGNICKSCYDWTGSNNPFYGKTHSAKVKKAMSRKASESLRAKWKDSDYRSRVIAAVSKPRRAGFGREQSVRVSQWYADNPRQRRLRSEAMRKSWEDGKITPSVNSSSESKKEIALRKLIDEVLCGVPVEKKWIRVGKRRFVPDVMVNEEIIVEFFGNFWHANPFNFNPEDIIHHGKTAQQIWDADSERIAILTDAGYQVLVIWEDEWDRIGGDDLCFAVTAMLDGEVPDDYVTIATE